MSATLYCVEKMLLLQDSLDSSTVFSSENLFFLLKYKQEAKSIHPLFYTLSSAANTCSGDNYWKVRTDCLERSLQDPRKGVKLVTRRAGYNTSSEVSFKNLSPSSQEWSQNCKGAFKAGLAASSALSASPVLLKMSRVKTTTDQDSDVTLFPNDVTALLYSPSYTFVLIQGL